MPKRSRPTRSASGSLKPKSSIIKPPSGIRIGYQDFALHYETVSLDNRHHYGMTRTDKSTIHVTDVGNKIENTNTLIHEILHAVCYTQGLKLEDAVEEMVVNSMANGLTGVIRDNPVLVEYILDQLGLLK